MYLSQYSYYEANGETILASKSSIVDEDDWMKNNHRCNVVYFDLQKDTALSQFKVVVNRIETAIAEIPDCDKAQQNLNSSNSGIKIKCSFDQGKFSLSITENNNSLNERDLYKKVKDAFVDYRNGPWVFEGSLSEGK